ncbi:MAG: cbb3-type cytochrome oxidase assembly protein CcoS [Planctomycetota bacterium]
MTLLTIAIPVALLVAGAALMAFIWAARTDQFEDLDTPPKRMLMEDAPLVPCEYVEQDAIRSPASPQVLPCAHGSDRVSPTSPTEFPSRSIS